VLIVGSNTAESHPVLATRVKRAHKRVRTCRVIRLFISILIAGLNQDHARVRTFA
jgi:predicted molibdopterin-dependent oxidoreductase YjgC